MIILISQKIEAIMMLTVNSKSNFDNDLHLP